MLLAQTYYADKGEKPAIGKFLAFDHITFYVGNAKQVHEDSERGSISDTITVPTSKGK